MELRQLVYFEAVVRYGGFSRAAEQLHIAQPAVSAQIRRLETELGTTLLDRTTRRVDLTTAGELLLIRVRAVLGQLDGARADLDDLAAVLRGHVRIGATVLLGSFDLPAALARFHRDHPGVALTLRTGLIAELLDELDAGAVDIVVGPVDADLADRFAARPLVAERVVLVTPPGRPIRQPVDLADFRDDLFVCLPGGSGLRAILLAAGRRAGFEPRVQFETDNPDGVRELVAAGLGVALVAETTARRPGPDVAVHVLPSAPDHPPFGSIRLRSRRPSPAVRAWQRQLRETYPDRRAGRLTNPAPRGPTRARRRA